MIDPDFSRVHDRIASGALPDPLPGVAAASDDGAALAALFETQATSRALDLAARRLGREKRGFYSIGSSGHEGNAAVAHAFRTDDMAFLHYRSGAFLLERVQRLPGATPIWDMALSFVASSDDPMSGGRHKVLGSKAAFVPPQTSTIASHLPKAVGAAVGVTLARTHKRDDGPLAHDGVVIASFGDASVNHSTAQGALNAAAWTAHRGAPCPIVFVCEDNGLGISVPTPEGWVAAQARRPAIVYVACDGRDIVDALRGAREAETIARRTRRPVFLHMRTVRLMGHAGSDVETAYRSNAKIEADLEHDPLLHTARRVIEAGGGDAASLAARLTAISAQVDRVMEAACDRPKLSSPADVAEPIAPPADGGWRDGRVGPPTPAAADVAATVTDDRARAQPQHMSRLIALTLADLMAKDRDVVVFGEDVARKGGVYGATTRLADTFGPSRVFDTLLDEQTILGLAIGLSHAGYVPIPEIQFLAYLHNAADQIRGEAATLSFFSNGQYANPMVVRIAGLGYQKGFGGHFHNDNAIAALRDIPGLIVACPSHGADAVALLREAYRLAREEGRVVVMLEPIALYGVRDLIEEGDGLLAARFDACDTPVRVGETARHGAARDLLIVSYGNGAVLSRRAAARLKADYGVEAGVLDLRWLAPLPIDAVVKAAREAPRVLIVDECRASGGPSEGVITGLVEHGVTTPIRRIAAWDTFIPLGPAATAPLPSEASIVDEAAAWLGLTAVSA